MKKTYTLFIGMPALLLSLPGWSSTRNVVKDYAADNTGSTYATTNIQKAIDDCEPGDVLLFPDGKYLLSNGLNLKSDITVITAVTTRSILICKTGKIKIPRALWVN